MGKNTERIGREEMAYQLVRERLAQQIESVKNLDIKASIILAIIGVIFSGYLQSVIEHVDSPWARGATLLVLTLAGVAAVGTFVPTKDNEWDDWRNDPDPAQLLILTSSPEFKSYSEEEVTSYILESMSDSYEHNKRLYRKRYNFLYGSLSLVLVAVIIIGIQVVFEV